MRALLACAAALAGCAAPAADPPAADFVRAVRLDAPLVVDGLADRGWDAAPETTVPLEGSGGPSACRVRAAVVHGSLHLLLRWEDATEDRAHRPWVRDAAGAWTAAGDLEDQASVAFPLEGPFTADMTSPVEALWDVWHWKAFRTDPAGYAQDRVHRMSLSDPGGKRHEERLPDGRTLFIVRPEDAGDPVTQTLAAPLDEAAAGPAPQYRARRPTGSAADVAARGAWRDGVWTLELARALRTGHADDRDLLDLDAIPFAIAILDRAVDEAHASSGVLRLHLPPPPPPGPERKP